jgi:hypothetical protein
LQVGLHSYGPESRRSCSTVVAAEPTDVAEAGNAYVAAKRQEAVAMADRTYTSADAAAGNAVVGRLNRLCAV